MNSTKHLIFANLLVIFIISLGVAGYMMIEGWSLLDALYMTVQTLTTVGYNEVHEMTEMGRIFTVLLICVGVAFFLYVAGAVVQFMIEGRIRTILGRRRLNKKIDRLKNHYIICGYGRIGKILCKMLSRKPIELVVIEKDPELIPVMDANKILYISGDATEEENLLSAGIQHAKGLIAALATDTENVFLVLTARQLNPGLFIMACANRDESKSKLLAAGANRVESPYDIGATSMAQRIIRPTVTNFLDFAFAHRPYDIGATSMAQRIIRPTVTNFLDFAFAHRRKDIQMEEMPVSPSSALVNVMLKDSGIRQQFNLIIIAIKKPDGNMLFNPSFETVIEGGDTVIAVGQENNLQQLEKILNPAGQVTA